MSNPQQQQQQLPATATEQVSYLKHLVECNCILPQYKNKKPPFVFHKFVVFSIINSDGSIKPCFAQCNNCDAVHRVTEVGKSVQLRRETIAAIPRVEELKTGIPEPVVKILEAYHPDITTWQEVRFIYDNELWGKPVILSKEEDSGLLVGKYILIVGKELYKVDTFTSDIDEEG